MTPEQLEAIRQRNEKRKRNYGESQQRADGEMYTTGAEDDIDALILEVERQAKAYEYLRLRCEGIHNLAKDHGVSCGTYCVEYTQRRVEMKATQTPCEPGCVHEQEAKRLGLPIYHITP